VQTLDPREMLHRPKPAVTAPDDYNFFHFFCPLRFM
jgi:hypothetical protein